MTSAARVEAGRLTILAQIEATDWRRRLEHALSKARARLERAAEPVKDIVPASASIILGSHAFRSVMAASGQPTKMESGLGSVRLGARGVRSSQATCARVRANDHRRRPAPVKSAATADVSPTRRAEPLREFRRTGLREMRERDEAGIAPPTAERWISTWIASKGGIRDTSGLT
jgi:hypothetical protein